MIMASAKLEEEENRARRILHPTTFNKLKATMEETVVQKHMVFMQDECINSAQLQQILSDLYCRHSNMTAQDVQKMFDQERNLTYDECKTLGLVDGC